MQDESIIKGMCLNCSSECGAIYHVRNGILAKIEGDKEHSVSRGMLCPRAIAIPDVVCHPERLKHPLKRVGERGSGQWEQISWDEALDTITNALEEKKKKYGAESLLFSSSPDAMRQGRGQAESMFAALFGTPNWLIQSMN